MDLTYVPLLKTQREIYDLPRDMNRFKAYLEALQTPEKNDMALPLASMNPMGKDHVPALLDQYIASQTDERAAEAVAQLAPTLNTIDGAFQVTLVIADDIGGGWTNRFDFEFRHRFQSKAHHRRGWLTGQLWTSDVVSAENAIQEARCAVLRGAYIQQHGYAETLGQMLAQEGYAMRNAGCTAPSLEPDEITYTRDVIAPHLNSDNYAIQFAALFGDAAAETFGYTPLGLSPRAGLALALAENHKE